jgi:hypothetical protein
LGAAAMPWRFGRTWLIGTDSPATTRASNDSSGNCVAHNRRSPPESSSPTPASSCRWITAPDRWCAIRKPESIAAHGYLLRLWAIAAKRFDSSPSLPVHARGRSCLGGCSRIVVLDNLKEGVLKPDIYDPTLNPLFRDMLTHYGVVAMPCRIQDPDRKGKVESGVGHAQKTPLKNQRFESLEEAQAYLDNWETRWADTRIHGTTKRQVAAMFAEERPFLLPLPIEPFRYYQYGQRVVHLDGCVEVEAAYYSVPPGWIGKLVNVQWDSLHVRILDAKTHQLLREHVRQERGRHRIRPEDNPSKTPLSTTQLLARAARAGAQIGVFCEALHLQHGAPSVRRILGVLSLAKKYGVDAVEDACAAALELRVLEYRFVRRYLERRPQLTLRQSIPSFAN